MRVEFLLEEQSMANFLTVVLPKILPRRFQLNHNCFLRPHNGKSDLVKSIPKKIKAFSTFHEQVKIIIVHDQDSNDCLKLKSELFDLCRQNNSCSVPVLIRIACRELESWYLGDMDALEAVYNGFKANKHKNKAKFRNPDKCNAADELRKLIPGFQKGKASKLVSEHIQIDGNISHSFNQFISGVARFFD